ncbi:hypothetical protein C1645_785136 [Glomus cerebriforme]|uniref:Uncharacterized protein n=1 Tax=Glomus cerebriforme TaxID=658196 RepID=A0A397SJ32_9GLOM|nr:hypothetical protein C1645_785136 [Glomus cerebriforme]
MEEKHRTPPVNPLLLRIRTSIASLRSTSYATNYNLLPLTTVSPNTSPIPPTTFRHGRLRSILFPPHFVRRKWGYFSFMLLILFIVIVRSQYSKRSHVPFEETPAVTGHTKESKHQIRPPVFSTFIDNYPKQLAILILTSSDTSLDTFSKSIIDTWGKIAKQNKSLSVDLWFATPEDTLKKFGWPNIPYDEVGRERFEKIDDIIEDNSINGNNIKGLEKELKNLLKTMIQETMIFKDPTELSDEQKEFQKLTKALHYLYENHLDHYNYILKITDKTFVRLPKLLELLSILKSTENNNFLPKLIGRPNLDHETKKTFCFKGSGYIINKNLLTMIGPHLPFCLATLIKNSGDTKENDLQEDLAIERCFTQYVPMFKGCETFVGDNDDDNNNDLKKLRGYEFLYLKPDDEINWGKYKKPLEMFNDGYINGWRFADAIVMGEVKDPSNLIKLEEWYGKDGKFNELVREMGGVIPDPEPTQEDKYNEDNEGGNDKETTDVQSQQSESVDILITSTTMSTEISTENVNDEIISENLSTTVDNLVTSTISSEESPEEKKQIDETYSISKISIATLEEKVLSQTKVNQQTSTTTISSVIEKPTIIVPVENNDELIDGNNNVNDGDYDDTILVDNHNGNDVGVEGEVNDDLPLNGEELAEP